MKLRLLICTLFATFCIMAVHYLNLDNAMVLNFYERNLRGSLFSGLLTVGGFLLSVKTFIVIKLKESVYDHKTYIDRFKELKKLDSSVSRYGPLQRLSNFLFWSVLSSITAAISQLTLGLLNNYWFCLTAIWAAIFAVGVLLSSLLLMKSSLNDYFDFINSNEG